MWTDGYVTEIEYTYGYFQELSPLHLQLALALKGIDHNIPSSGISYLELGYGQGLSLNIHGAATPGTYWGADFNPAQAVHAQRLAQAGGADVTVLEASFEEMAARQDLPEFDIIALHGIWSWISEANRNHIIDIARRRLKPGGIFYVSYNCMPGWAPAMPLRYLMSEYGRRVGRGAITDQVHDAMAFLQKVKEVDALYFKANPSLDQRLKKLQGQNSSYLAHEYFNASWDALNFSEVAEALSEAKLTYAASAHLKDHVDAVNYSPDALALINDIKDPILQETVRDYCTNKPFRRDIYVKGARRLTPLEQAQRLQAQRFMAIKPAVACPKTITGAYGKAGLQETIYTPVIEALVADGHVPKTLAHLHAAPGCDALSFDQLVQAIEVLCGVGFAVPAHDADTVSAVRKTTRALNTALCLKAETGSDIVFLASPVTGSGISVARIEQLFLRARETKEKDIAAYVWRLLKAQGQSVLKDGEVLQGDETSLEQLRALHADFTDNRLPILKRLGIVS